MLVSNEKSFMWTTPILFFFYLRHPHQFLKVFLIEINFLRYRGIVRYHNNNDIFDHIIKRNCEIHIFLCNNRKVLADFELIGLGRPGILLLTLTAWKHRLRDNIIFRQKIKIVREEAGK